MDNAVIKSISFFLLAGLLEIGGGYLMWLWLKEKWAWWVGALALVGFGIIPTLQPANFGRVYAAYGGVFDVLSIIWGWGIDKKSNPMLGTFSAAFSVSSVSA